MDCCSGEASGLDEKIRPVGVDETPLGVHRRQERGPRPKAGAPVFSDQAQEAEEWRGRGETRKIQGHAHQGGGWVVCVTFCHENYIYVLDLGTWRPSVIVV